jgi:purine-binding chemotaxis protein CheW
MSTDKAPSQLVVFSLAENEYALPITRVQEIIQYQSPSPVAAESDWVRGVINLRSKVIPVCDLGLRLGLSAEETTAGIIVVVETETGTAGVIVDQVDEVLTIGADQLEPSPAAAAAFIDGIAKIDDRLVMLLDPNTLLGEEAFTAA